jgi:hypothetical protein
VATNGTTRYAAAAPVTYKSLLSKWVESSPEHMLVFDGMAEVDGLKVPTHFTIYEAGTVYASCAIGQWALDISFDTSRMTPA